jgi:hypothetical protein
LGFAYIQKHELQVGVIKFLFVYERSFEILRGAIVLTAGKDCPIALNGRLASPNLF